MILARVFRDAAGLWQRDRDLWVRAAGVFFFLPAFAVMLFYQPVQLTMPADKSDVNALAQQWVDLILANIWWVAPMMVWQVFSTAVILVLALDSARPPLSAALWRALRILPAMMLVYLAVTVLTGFGLSLFVVPGLYIIGRTFLSQPMLIAEPKLGPLGALVAGIQRSHRRGWLLFFVPASIFLMQFVTESMVATFGALLGEASSAPVHFIFSAFEAAISAAFALAQALLLAAAYRETAGTRQGI